MISKVQGEEDEEQKGGGGGGGLYPATVTTSPGRSEFSVGIFPYPLLHFLTSPLSHFSIPPLIRFHSSLPSSSTPFSLPINVSP